MIIITSFHMYSYLIWKRMSNNLQNDTFFCGVKLYHYSYFFFIAIYILWNTLSYVLRAVMKPVPSWNMFQIGIVCSSRAGEGFNFKLAMVKTWSWTNVPLEQCSSGSSDPIVRAYSRSPMYSLYRGIRKKVSFCRSRPMFPLNVILISCRKLWMHFDHCKNNFSHRH